MPMNTDSRTTGVTVKADIDFNDTDILRVGGEYLRYRLNDTWPPSPDCGNCMGMMAPLTFLNINDGQRDRLGAFVEWESNWTPEWFALMGVRFEQVTSNVGEVMGYNGMMYTTSSVGTLADFNAMNRQRTDNNWDATALGRYTPDATSSYEFGIARKTRSPNLYERYSWSDMAMIMAMNNFVGDGNGYVGNPDLKPEVAHTVSLTADWHSADNETGIKVMPYYSHIRDYIDAVRLPGDVGVAKQFVTLQYANHAARLYGLDIAARMLLAKNDAGDVGLKARLNYTHGTNLDTGDGLYNTMPLNAKVTLTHEYAGWSNALEVVGVTSKRDVSQVRNEIETAGYALVHLRSAYAWKQVRLDVGIENLFNRGYALPTGGAYVGQGMTMAMNGTPWGIAVPGMGRSFYAGVTVKR
jgi:iron complex outermembrane receptor protein